MGLAEILVDRGLITAERLSEALAAQRDSGLRLDRVLVERGWIKEDQLLRLLSQEYDIPVVDLSAVQVDVELLRSLPARLIYRRGLVPLYKENGTLVVATSDPFDLYSFDEMRLLTGMEIRPMLAPADEIDKIIKTHYGVGGDTVDEMMDTGDLEVVRAGEGDGEDLLEMAQEASVIKLVNEIFLEGVKERATDIHIEPYEKDLKVRYRIDGVLQEQVLPPDIRRFQPAIISRIKIMANMNIAEKRLPQDGRIKFQIGGRQIDVRVSVIPMLHGEGVVLRLLDQSNVSFYGLPQLGMAADTFAVFRQLIERPHGIILVTGPTGSGKSTTLYSALKEIVSPDIKVLTIEDPVEYHQAGVSQIQVSQKTGLTFALALRHILRHDPDVIMIGEIRDLETAEAAVQAALTGHLVFSTLHTNDACSSATRLLDMGMEPFLVTSTLEAAMAQRLVRTVCAECKEAYEPDPVSLPRDFNWQGGKLARGAGCKKCRGTGYYGRTGLFELMVTSDRVREKIMQRTPAGEIAEIAKSEGLRLLREDGWLKVRAGITTPEEVVRATKV